MVIDSGLNLENFKSTDCWQNIPAAIPCLKLSLIGKIQEKWSINLSYDN